MMRKWMLSAVAGLSLLTSLAAVGSVQAHHQDNDHCYPQPSRCYPQPNHCYPTPPVCYPPAPPVCYPPAPVCTPAPPVFYPAQPPVCPPTPPVCYPPSCPTYPPSSCYYVYYRPCSCDSWTCYGTYNCYQEAYDCECGLRNQGYESYVK